MVPQIINIFVFHLFVHIYLPDLFSLCSNISLCFCSLCFVSYHFGFCTFPPSFCTELKIECFARDWVLLSNPLQKEECFLCLYLTTPASFIALPSQDCVLIQRICSPFLQIK